MATFLKCMGCLPRNIVVGFLQNGWQGRWVSFTKTSQCAPSQSAIDINSSNKAARFIRFCDAFNVVTRLYSGYSPEQIKELWHHQAWQPAVRILKPRCPSNMHRRGLMAAHTHCHGKQNLRAGINYAWLTPSYDPWSRSRGHAHHT